MITSTSREMADLLIDNLSLSLQNKATDYLISDLNEDPNHRHFSVEFTAFNYFCVVIYYDQGRITTAIVSGKHLIKLPLKTKWWEECDMKTFISELEKELKLRIPDKFLEERL